MGYAVSGDLCRAGKAMRALIPLVLLLTGLRLLIAIFDAAERSSGMDA